MSSSDPAEPRLVTFLVDRAVHEQDPVRLLTLSKLIREWRALAPNDSGDDVWNAMVELSHTYMHATGYERRWSR